VVWSMYNHHASANEKWYGALNGTPGLVGDPIEKPVDDIRQYFLDWMAKDGHPFWPFWENMSSWWAIRDLPNVEFLHFGVLKSDMRGQMRRVAKFLDIDIDESKWDAIVEHCSFDYMKKNAIKTVPLGGAFWDGGAATFVNKGSNGRWRDTLTEEDNARYESMAKEKLGEDCARWLATGEMPA
jgi:aryl sulfotransferase